MTALIALYNDIYKYPPTLNAISALAQKFRKVVVLCRKLSDDGWRFSENVEIIYSNINSIPDLRKISKYQKIKLFIDFQKKLKREIRNNEIKLLLCYDDLAAYAGYLSLKHGDHKPLFWYHSHDVIDLKTVSFLSLSSLAKKMEKIIFEKVNVFTLPSMERKKYFDLSRFTGNLYHLPNYPSTKVYKKNGTYLEGDTIKLVYQGNLSFGHGFEEIIPLLGKKINKKKIVLSLVGPIKELYKSTLLDIAKENNVLDYLSIIDSMPYSYLRDFTIQHHIGLAIHRPKDIMYATGASSSNKIYEYAACGLPVILFDTPHYRSILEYYNWTRFTDLSSHNIIHCIQQIDSNYKQLAGEARKDFESSLNFECAISSVLDKIKL